MLFSFARTPFIPFPDSDPTFPQLGLSLVSCSRELGGGLMGEAQAAVGSGVPQANTSQKWGEATFKGVSNSPRWSWEQDNGTEEVFPRRGVVLDPPLFALSLFHATDLIRAI